jgi:hypothetical protein
MDARLRILAQAAGVCEIRDSGDPKKVNLDIIPWLGATSPPWFKALFLILIVLAIPGFFAVMWLMSRSHKDKKKSRLDEENH